MKKTFLPLLAVFCLALLAAACGSLDKQDPLTSKERAWLKEHGPIKVGADLTYHPFSFAGADGQAEGICAALWRAMGKKLGFEVRFEALNDDKEMEGLSSGALDSSTGMFPLGARKKTLDFSEPFYPVTAAIFVANRAHGVRGLEDLSRIKVGAVKGDSGAAILTQKQPHPGAVRQLQGLRPGPGAKSGPGRGHGRPGDALLAQSFENGGQDLLGPGQRGGGAQRPGHAGEKEQHGALGHHQQGLGVDERGRRCRGLRERYLP